MPEAAQSGSVRDTGKWLVLAVLLVVLDQITKYIAVKAIEPATTIPLLPFLSLVLTYNTGAAFSFLADASGWQRWFFVLIAVAASVLLVWMLNKNRRDVFLCIGLTLILGGALGNLVDRVLVGKVVDFVLLYWRQYHWPAFNVADSCITVGAAMLIWDGFFRSHRRPGESVTGDQ